METPCGHAHVVAVPANPARGPGRRRDARPTAPVRAGYIRRDAPASTPAAAGLKVLRKVGDRARGDGGHRRPGADFPALCPVSPTEATNRWTEYGENLFRIVDRKGADLLLGRRTRRCSPRGKDLSVPTRTCPSVSSRSRTVPRRGASARAGLLRGREFIMKDSYSFDVTDEGLEASYRRTVRHTRACSTGSGSSTSSARRRPAPWAARRGGVPAVSPHGEDTFVRNDTGTYAANVEAVVVAKAARSTLRVAAAHVAGSRHPRHPDDRDARGRAQSQPRPQRRP